MPLLLILCADAYSLFDATEQHEPYVDDGRFAMSLAPAMQAQGISSCCPNWCMEGAEAQAAEGNLDPSERIVMFMPVGYSVDGAVVPQPPRLQRQEVWTFEPIKD